MLILNATEFYKKAELKDNSIYSFKPIEDMEIETYQIKKKIVLVLVRVKFS